MIPHTPRFNITKTSGAITLFSPSLTPKSLSSLLSVSALIPARLVFLVPGNRRGKFIVGRGRGGEKCCTDLPLAVTVVGCAGTRKGDVGQGLGGCQSVLTRAQLTVEFCLQGNKTENELSWQVSMSRFKQFILMSSYLLPHDSVSHEDGTTLKSHRVLSDSCSSDEQPDEKKTSLIYFLCSDVRRVNLSVCVPLRVPPQTPTRRRKHRTASRFDVTFPLVSFDLKRDPERLFVPLHRLCCLRFRETPS